MDWLYGPWNSSGQNTRMGSLSLLQEIFPAQGSNPSLPHWRWILYQLSHKGSPRILEWVAYPFSSKSSRPRNQTQVSRISSRFFTIWVTRGAPTKFMAHLQKQDSNNSTHLITPRWVSEAMQPKTLAKKCFFCFLRYWLNKGRSFKLSSLKFIFMTNPYFLFLILKMAREECSIVF